jgi:hypothetical protein
VPSCFEAEALEGVRGLHNEYKIMETGRNISRGRIEHGVRFRSYSEGLARHVGTSLVLGGQGCPDGLLPRREGADMGTGDDLDRYLHGNLAVAT